MKLVWSLLGPAIAAVAVNAQATGSASALQHDPSIFKVGSTYYVAGSHNGLRYLKSTDLQNWTPAATPFGGTGVPDWVATRTKAESLWAPEIHKFGNMFYLFYCGSTFGSRNSVIGFATSPALEGSAMKWTDQGEVISTVASSSYNAIDPYVFWDPATQAPWLFFGSWGQGIKGRKLNPTTLKLAADDTTLYQIASNPKSNPANAIEAPTIAYNNKFYYLFVSLDKCCAGADSTYKIAAARATKITGPYLAPDGSLAGSKFGGWHFVDFGDSERIGPGGQSVQFIDGGWKMVNHYYPKSTGGGPARFQVRNLCFPNDWPTVC
ncbi:Arabinanase Arb43a [Cladochytrium replicatum]|nr:Arabinanase Arb43a [Cladochytrium replicatum]